MATIEERAEQYARAAIELQSNLSQKELVKALLVDAYLTGAARAQRDYVAHYSRG